MIQTARSLDLKVGASREYLGISGRVDEHDLIACPNKKCHIGDSKGLQIGQDIKSTIKKLMYLLGDWDSTRD